MARRVQYLKKVFQSEDGVGQFLTCPPRAGAAERLPGTRPPLCLPDYPFLELPQQGLLHKNVRAAMILDL